MAAHRLAGRGVGAMASCSLHCRGVLPITGCLPLYRCCRGVLPSTGCLPLYRCCRGNSPALAACLCSMAYAPAPAPPSNARRSRRMMASRISARPRPINLASGTKNPTRRWEDIHDRRPLAHMLSVRHLNIALCLCGHCAWSDNVSVRSFLRVMLAGMPHKLRHLLKSCTRLTVSNSRTWALAEDKQKCS